jgi:ketosteroid isomerase-like protein
MSEENVRLVGEVIEAWNRRDIAVLELFAPDVEFEVSQGTDVDGTYHGLEDTVRAVGRFWGAFSDYRSVIEEARENGDCVLITARHFARGKQSGVAVDMTNWQTFTLREGKVVRYGIYGVREKALEVAGLSE